MRVSRPLLVVPAVLLLCALASGRLYSAPRQQNKAAKNAVFQVSTITALMQGVFDGDMTFEELKRHGDFGIGTLNALDGEVIGVDGQFYQIRSDGSIHLVPPDARTPFMAVIFFVPEKTVVINKRTDYKQLEAVLDSLLKTNNVTYAVQLRGRFHTMKTRSVPRQNRPYTTLVNAAKHQAIFEMKEVEGTLVGFKTPEYMQSLNVPGYHMHFITKDHKAGGHVLDCTFDHITIEIAACRRFSMALPNEKAFDQADLNHSDRAGLNQVEKGRR
jgi:acetolactate decarboxylase